MLAIRSIRFFGAALLLSILASSVFISEPPAAPPETAAKLFARDNLVAWCIVPFDSKKRGPEDRAEMLSKLGFKRFAYDWRAEHIPTFDAEIAALNKRGIALSAFWTAPGELNRESRLILDVLKRHGIKTELWVLIGVGEGPADAAEQKRRVEAAAAKLKPLAEEAEKIGCRLALYNHGGWFGEPENQVAIIELLKTQGIQNLGIVYNLHHGHDHLDRFPGLLRKMMPYLTCLNLNGMEPNGERLGKKILPLGQGSLDLGLLRTIRDSGYSGPIGILGHTQDDAEERLKDNLDGLDWLVPQLDGKPAGPKPRPRTYAPPAASAAAKAETEEVAKLVADAKQSGDAKRGAAIFTDARFGCVTCHKVGALGGPAGPDLSNSGGCLSPEQIAESLLYPRKQIKEGYVATSVAASDGRVIQGYATAESARELTLREATTGIAVKLAKADIDERREIGTLMPEGLAAAMSRDERRDVVRFLMDLGKPNGATADMLSHGAHAPAAFPFTKSPLHPEAWPNLREYVNRDRLYDFYTKEALYFSKQAAPPALLPGYPGIDGGQFGHWGNQFEDVWADDRWNSTDLGRVMCGIFRGAGVTVPKGVCVRIGDRQEMAICFNPQTLRYEALWRGGFLKFSKVRHGFMDGAIMDGEALPAPEGKTPDQPFIYHGYYRHGDRVVFSYRVGDVEMLDSPWVENGKFVRTVGPAADHPLGALTKGGPARSTWVFEAAGKLGAGRPYAIDTISPPFENPWKAPMFFGDHDFLPDGSALICTIQGDVWRVEGLDESLSNVRWRRFASGLNLALGLVVADGKAHVLGRDQITRLHDLNHDGEADYYECVSNAYETSVSGHDFICGLQRDSAGNFYTVSGNQGLVRISPDGKKAEVLATGFRNPDGLGLAPDGLITVPCSEGEWTPASMICGIREGGYYGYGGPKNDQAPDLPLVYLPRGLDNSSGSQVTVTSDRWGPLKGSMLHFSYGTASQFLLLRERVDGLLQGAVVPLPGEFLSGSHRGRFNPKDGQLYVSGMGGWGHYSVSDGSFQRVRYAGGPVTLPTAFHAHENGVLLTFSNPVDPQAIADPSNRFAQAWNYRYSSGYGSPEFSARHPDTPGHDRLAIRSTHVLDDGRSVFVEIPEIQPVNQLHLHLRVDSGRPIDVFATVHKPAAPFSGFPGYRPVAKTIAPHPILADLARAKKTTPNPWRKSIRNAREIKIEAGKNLTFSTPSITAQAGEPIRLVLINPDAVPHNWALIKPGKLAVVGDLANKLVSDPEAASRHYVPKSDDILYHTDVVFPQDQAIIYFHAPSAPGRYPFLCTFPGHWMVMNGTLVVR